MPRACTVCTHRDREAINAALVAGELSNRRIAAQYRLSEAAVRRHKKEHLPAHLTRAQEAQEVADADRLLAQVEELRIRAVRILDKAEKARDWNPALRGIREARGCLELLARLMGQVQEQQQQTVNIWVHEEWRHLEAVILDALEPHPEARDALTAALRREAAR